MRMVWGNYLAAAGSVIVAGVYVTRAAPRDVIALQRGQMSYVSQFRRVLPRVLVLDVVSEPMLLQGVAEAAALDRARALLARLNIPQALCVWSLTTFSGGEQQRVHIARGFIRALLVLLLDERQLPSIL